MMTIHPRNSRVLVFLEGTKDGRLTDQISKGGIRLPSVGGMDGLHGNLGIQNRWAIITAVGPKCTEVKAGDRVCVYAQKWTEGMKLNDEWYWFTDEEHIMLIDMLYRKTNGKEKIENEVHLGKSVHSL